MTRHKVLIFVVSYNAERFITAVLDRIPAGLWDHARFDLELLVIDDGSKDQTFERATEYARIQQGRSITVLSNPTNQGYGGNQKIGYHYAVQKGFDAVVLLHGDGQYAPELLAEMVDPILAGSADVVLGSRMLQKRRALRGGMPLYKWVGNQVLTFVQNMLLGTRLAEFHTGYRAYRVSSLAAVPFSYDSDYFDFDTDILIQLLDTGARFKEIPIPTYYGEEISAVNGFRYGALIIRSSIQSRLARFGIFYDPRYDYEKRNDYYSLKLGYDSSHQFALDRIGAGASVVDIGCGPGLMAKELALKQVRTISIDHYISDSARQHSTQCIEADLDHFDFHGYTDRVDTVLALDIIEHLKSPEAFLRRLRERHSAAAPTVILTTGNVAFLPLRIALLCGQFNYGKRGILDLTHTRLFTFGSMRRLLKQQGYDILQESGIPPPFPEALGDNGLSRLLLSISRVLVMISRRLFAYQIAVVAKPRVVLGELLARAYESASERQLAMDGRMTPTRSPLPAVPAGPQAVRPAAR